MWFWWGVKGGILIGAIMSGRDIERRLQDIQRRVRVVSR